MEQDDGWLYEYFTPEQQAAIVDFGRQFYPDANHPQTVVQGAGYAQYAALAAGLQLAATGGKSADSAEVQKLAAGLLGLIGQFTPADAEATEAANLPLPRQASIAAGLPDQAMLDGTTPIQNKR